MTKKQFTVEFTTKGAFNIEIAYLDPEDFDINNLSSDDIDAIKELLNDSDYLAESALGAEWNGPFSFKVYDENQNVIFHSESFGDFKFITAAEDALDDESISPSAVMQKAMQEWEKRWKTERDTESPGIYAVALHELKWRTYRFVVEDERFCPKKLFFVDNKLLMGIAYDNMTDPEHIFYDRFVEAEDFDDCYYEYGTSFYIMERGENGIWVEIRDVED